jgi:hypothetical protein
MRRITALLLALVMLIGGFAGGYFLGETKSEKYSPYEVVFKSLDTMSSSEKLDYYQGILTAETTPTQVRYVMEKILNDNIDNDVKNNMIAFYLNHIQYYMSTYTNFITLYSSIMKNNSDTINYEEASAANKINDQVLKTVVQEIYNSDMKIIMPPSGSTDSPYVIVDYDSLASRYGKIFNDATKEYIKFKEVVQSGELYDALGRYDMEKTAEYIVQANDFIVKYDNYPLVSDVIYSYILASKMYIGTYNMSSEFTPDEATIASYTNFVENYKDTPVTAILKEIIALHAEGKPITMEHANKWNEELDALIG